MAENVLGMLVQVIPQFRLFGCRVDDLPSWGPILNQKAQSLEESLSFLRHRFPLVNICYERAIAEPYLASRFGCYSCVYSC